VHEPERIGTVRAERLDAEALVEAAKAVAGIVRSV
jgi:hypothetical protein